jgi:FkbM family methyltransferase
MIAQERPLTLGEKWKIVTGELLSLGAFPGAWTTFILVFAKALMRGLRNSPHGKLFKLSLLSNEPIPSKYQFIEFAERNLSHSRSADFQDLLVYFFTSFFPTRSTFLEIGACDGEYKSNCSLLEKSGWVGMAIEPNPIYREQFSRNRSSEFLNHALLPREPKGKGPVLSFDPQLPSSGKISFLREDLLEEAATSISYITVKKLVRHWREKFQDDPVYVSIDVEGLDFEILKSFWKECFRPELISIEHNFRPSDLDNLVPLLHKFKYSIVFDNFTRNDILIIRTDFLTEIYKVSGLNFYSLALN